MQESPPHVEATEHRHALSRTAALLSSSLSLEEMLDQTVGACLPALGDFGFFDVRHGETVRRAARAHCADDIERLLRGWQWVPQVRDDDLNLCALSTGRPALHPAIDDEWYRSIAANEAHLEFMRRLGIRSMLTVPMRFRDELLGALTLFMGRSGRRHSARHLDTARELAALAAPFVANARLLNAERAARAVAEESRRRFELLASAGAVLSRSLEPRTTLEAIATTMVPSIADWCRVDLLDENGVLQRALTYHSDPEKSRFGTELTARLKAAPGAIGSMAWVVQTGQPYLAHFEAPHNYDPVRDRDLLTFARAIGMRAYFMVPLIARGRTLGALGALQAESGRPLRPEDCALISELAQRAALALDNARLYAEAEAALKQAQSANRAKDEFLAMLGHELRNPLAPIVTALKIMDLREGDRAAEERRIIERQVAHLSRLVDDLLDVSRITQGKVSLERDRVDLSAVVARALELTRPVYEARERPIEVELPQSSLTVLGDAVRLAQVLCNLLTNAAKFTPGSERVRLRLAEHEGRAQISVEDEGAGIAPELLPRVFDVFVQGEQRSDRQAGGLGLGLAIVSMLVRMHGGSVSAASAGPGKGSQFVVTLPLAGTASPEPALRKEPTLPPPRRGGRILIVDDNDDAAQTLAELLALSGYEARTARDGQGALAMLASFQPQVALLDIGLPGMDGYELARRLRAHPRTHATRLIALTGYGRGPDRRRALDARFDEHLVKPVPPEQLLAVLERSLRD